MNGENLATETRIEGRVGIITLNRPKTFNALSSALIEGIEQAVKNFESSGQVRAVLIEARGEHFCTGANLQEVKRTREDPAALERFLRKGLEAFRRLESSPLPVVAAVQGLCLAGGLELMLSCDVVFACRSARLGDQHSQYGLLPGWGGSQRLPRMIGARRALDLLYSARWLGADEAREMGLINYVVNDDTLHECAFDYCRELAERSPRGLSAMKRLVYEGADNSLLKGLAFEMGVAIDHFQSEDVSEGLAAFEARRKPEFR